MAHTDINLTEQISGILPVANGGTGAGTLTGIVVGSGTSPMTAVALNQSSIPENVTVSSATSLTLANTVSNYVFTGSSGTTWTLPSLSGNTGVRFWLENRGSATITLVPAGADHIWFRASVTTMTVAAGGSMELINDGTYWNSLSLDLINNAASLTSIPLTTPTVTGYTETVQAIGSLSTGTTALPALSGGTLMTAQLPTSGTVTLTMPTAAAGASFMLRLQQAASGLSANPTFTSVLWPSGVTYVPTGQASVFDILTFFCFDGTHWDGSYQMNYSA